VRSALGGLRHGLPLFLVLFAAYAATIGAHAQGSSRFTVPEAHNLLTAESIASDGDLDLRDEYRTRAWDDWFDGELRPTAGLTNGRLLEPQGIGFPLLIAPAYALGGPTAVQLFLAAITALSFCLAAGLGRRLVPDPWPAWGALVVGLSAPAIGAATSVTPEAAGGFLLAAGALFALRVRERVQTRSAFFAALCIAMLPWLALKLAIPGAVVAVAVARWLRRRNRGLAGFVAIEVVLTSVVVYVTVHDRLYGGLTPDAARLPGGGAGPTGASGWGEHLERAPRLIGLWLDRDVGVLRWAPFAALAFVAIWLLWRSFRDRLAVVVEDQVDVEVTALFLVLVCGAVLLTAVFPAPFADGPWFPGHELVPAFPCGAALCAWGLRHAPRLGAVLAALTLAASAWLLLVLRLDGAATLRPPSGDIPWLGAEWLLPPFGEGSAYEVVVLVLAGAGLAYLVVRETLAIRRRS
jgi:hypothetical protein